MRILVICITIFCFVRGVLGMKLERYMHHDSVCTAEFRRLKEQSENANDFLWKGIKSIPTIYGKPCLEVGCSIGAQTWDLQSKMNPMVKIIGIDIDPAAIEIAGTAL